MCGIKPKHGTALAHAQRSGSGSGSVLRRPTRALERERATEEGGRKGGRGDSWTIIIIIIISAREKQTNANERVSEPSRDASEPRRLSSGAKPQIVSAAAASADSTRLEFKLAPTRTWTATATGTAAWSGSGSGSWLLS